MSKKIRIRKLNEDMAKAGIIADLSAMKKADIDAIMTDWEDIMKKEAEADEELKTAVKKYGMEKTVKKVNLSKVDKIKIKRPDGSEDFIQPRSVAHFVRALIKEFRQDPQFNAILGYFDKDIIWTLDVPTAATDGIRIAMNPAFADSLLSKGVEMGQNAKKNNPNVDAKSYVGRCIAFVLIHEAYHQLYRHNRRARLKPETATNDRAIQDLANIAMDVEINRDIEYQFPSYFNGIHDIMDGCFDATFNNGEMWEQIFDAYYSGTKNPPQMNFNRQNGQTKNPQQKQNGQQGQQGGQSGQSGQSGQQGQQNNSNGGPNKGDLEKKSPDYLQGYRDALEKIKRGEITFNFVVESVNSGIQIPANVQNADDYEQGFKDAIETYRQLKQAAQDALNNQNSNPGDDSNGGAGNDGNSNNDSSSTGGNSGNQAGGESGQGNDSGQGGADDGDDIDAISGDTLEISEDASFGADFNFGDLLTQEEMAALAEAAGQPYDSEDLSADPIKKAEEYVQQHQSELNKIGQGSGGGRGKGIGNGGGNSMAEVLKHVSELFKPKIDWRRRLKTFFNGIVKIDDKLVYSRKRLTSNDPDMDAGRYTKPRIKSSYKDDGIAQVFHLMDNSGSMYSQTGGDGEDIFRQIFAEILAMEKKAHIQRSAAAFFCSGLKDNEVARWNAKTSTGAIFSILEKYRSLDKMGGTQFAPAMQSIFKMSNVYRKDNPTTLMLVYTDGEVGSSDINYVASLPRTQKSHMVYLIINSSEHYLNSCKEKLKDAGVKESCIICINAKDI